MEPKQDNRNKIIATILGIAAVLCAIAYFFSTRAPNPVPSGTGSVSTTTSTGAASSTSSSSEPTVTITPTSVSSSGSGYTVHMIPTGNAPAAPDFKSPLTFAVSIDPQIQASTQTQFAQAQAVLAKTPKDFNAWISLGDARKNAGDYTGAIADWQYALALYPANAVSYANLADLYANYTHDYPKAAAAYKAAIANDPKQAYLYENLVSLYTYQYPQATSTIVAVIKQGLAADPSDAGLQAALAKYQK